MWLPSATAADKKKELKGHEMNEFGMPAATFREELVLRGGPTRTA